MLVVGLTGGIATGKSTVSKSLEKHGLTIVDADLIAREVVYPGKSAYNKIIETFGDQIPDLIKDDRSLNREALGKHVFGNKENLGKLNRIVHPAVKQEIAWQIIKAYFTFKHLVILDVPLLYESGLYMICGKTITVTCDKDIQIKRLLARNPELTPEDADKRINSQMSDDERCYRSDYIISNNHGLAELEKNIDGVIKEVTPSVVFTVLDWFPPFGILSGFLTLTVRYLAERFKGTCPPKRQ